MKNKELLEKIEQALDEIRPYLQSDGGDITLVEVKDDKEVTVKLHGNCIDCTVNQMTLKNGVELTIQRYAPQIERVINLS